MQSKELSTGHMVSNEHNNLIRTTVTFQERLIKLNSFDFAFLVDMGCSRTN